mmetsp:Transcript_25207/g.80586  ORF Transcript_25207/g.80586 Transcript_25207/m.80586 type:complete len:94 (+) Transcript_25207:38-319(+)
MADYKPTTEIPVATAAPVVAVAPVAGRPAPPGAPPGGHYAMKPYCGVVTILITAFICVCAGFCPCDSKEVYIAPNGQAYTPEGTMTKFGPCTC